MAQQAHRERTPFSTDPEGALPVGLQLTWRLRALITTGHLAPGERLPSFRQLAEWAAVNVNTVRAVYEGLEQDGLVRSKQGQGTFVADGVEPSPQLEEIVADALRRAEEAGSSAAELAIVAAACAGMSSGDDASSIEASSGAVPITEDHEAIEVRNELRRQIARLEAELASYTRDVPDGLRTAHRSAEAHVAGVGELEETRDTLIVQLSEAQKAAERRAREEARARIGRRAARGPSSGSAATDPGTGPLSRAMSWWRDKA